MLTCWMNSYGFLAELQLLFFYLLRLECFAKPLFWPLKLAVAFVCFVFAFGERLHVWLRVSKRFSLLGLTVICMGVLSLHQAGLLF